MPGIFRRKWFPRRQRKFGIAAINNSPALVGQQATSALGSFRPQVTGALTGVSSTSQSGTFRTGPIVLMTGQQATSALGSFRSQVTRTLTGLSSTSQRGTFLFGTLAFVTGQHVTASVGSVAKISTLQLTGVSATAALHVPATQKSFNLVGVSATTQRGNFSVFKISTSHLTGVFATTQHANFTPLVVTPVDRTFFIAGINQSEIAPGIVLYPTSEDISATTNAPYVIGSSQFYTIGEVHWNGLLKTQNVAWRFVNPFKHIIEILDAPASIHTDITLIYYRWNIGVRAGFKVNDYPVSFGFSGTSIIAEAVPQTGKFFTVQFTSRRNSDNPRSMFAIFPNMVDDLLSLHTLYDGASGFETYRPTGYKVFETTTGIIWRWNGSSWTNTGTMSIGANFYVKRLRQVYEYDGFSNLVYTAGDGPSLIQEVLTYPAFGESIGKNFIPDAYSATAPVDFPSAYLVTQRPGDYDPWLPGV